MPKKGTKKQQTLRRKYLQSKRRAEMARKYAIRTQRQRQRSRLLGTLRGEKEGARVLNTGNLNVGNNTPLVNVNAESEPNGSTVNVFENNLANDNRADVNAPAIYFTVPRASWKRTPRTKTLKQLKKLSRLRNRAQTQRQREETIRKLRSLKQEAAELENAGPLPPLNANLTNNEKWEAMRLNQERQEREYEDMERTIAIQEYKQAKKLFYKAKKNTFFFRLDKREIIPKASQVLRQINQIIWFSLSLEILYKGTGLNDSFYFYLYRGPEEEYDNLNYNTNNNLDPFGPQPYYTTSFNWNVYKMDPVEYFKEIHFPKYYGWGGDETEFYAAHSGEFVKELISQRDMSAFIKSIPGFLEKVKREKEAPYTAPSKLYSLRSQALEKQLRKLERATRRSLPQNVENHIESFLRPYPVHPAYYTTRDNLSRIHTNLFTNNR